MKKLILMISLLFGVGYSFYAQSFGNLKGSILKSNDASPLKGVHVFIKNTPFSTLSDVLGNFYMSQVPTGKKVVIIEFNGLESQQFPVTITSDKTIDLGDIMLYRKMNTQDDGGLISLTDNDLSEDGNGGSENTSGLLQASKDAFLNVAAFQFGQARFRVRGYDSNKGTIMINGIEMNKFYDGRPQWSNWGGLNDVMRNRDFKEGLSPNQYTFGGLLGATNFDVRASSFRQGISVSSSTTNTNYSNRIMATYASGIDSKGWFYVISMGRRWSKEGHFDGTFYDANSFLLP